MHNLLLGAALGILTAIAGLTLFGLARLRRAKQRAAASVSAASAPPSPASPSVPVVEPPPRTDDVIPLRAAVVRIATSEGAAWALITSKFGLMALAHHPAAMSSLAAEHFRIAIETSRGGAGAAQMPGGTP